MKIISSDKTASTNTVQDLKDFNSQNLATQANKGDYFFSMMPALKKVSDLMADDIVELSTRIEF